LSAYISAVCEFYISLIVKYNPYGAALCLLLN